MENETTWNQGRGAVPIYIVDCFNGHDILYAAEQELVCVLLNSLHSTASGEIKYCQTYILMTAFCRAVSCGE